MSAPRTFVAIVEAQLSPTGILWPSIAAGLGHCPLFLTNRLSRYHELANFPRAFAGVEIVEADTNSAEGIQAAVRRWHESGELRALYTQCDYNLPVTARAARALGLPGLDPDAAEIARNKLRTRQVCSAAGVGCPDYAHARTVDEAVAAIRRLGLPCVVKPMTESASTDVALCSSEEEAVRHFTLIAGQDFDRRGQRRIGGALIEEYCLGYEVSVESVTVQGVTEVLGVTDKSLSPHPYFVEIGDVFPSCLPREITDEFARAAVDALKAVGHDFGAAHTELRMTASGPRLIEINARLGGAEIADMVEAALGIDVRTEVLRMHLGERPDLSPRRNMASATRRFTCQRSGILRAIHGVESARAAAGVVDVLMTAEAGQEIEAAVSDHELLGHVRTVAATPAEALRRAETAFNQISLIVE
jgi:biotin carboxylase